MDDREVYRRALILQDARDRYPHEACGVVVGSLVIPIANDHTDPEHFFNMDAAELLAVYEKFGDIDGMYHSHPGGNPRPSVADVDSAPPGKRYYIATLDAVHEWSM